MSTSSGGEPVDGVEQAMQERGTSHSTVPAAQNPMRRAVSRPSAALRNRLRHSTQKLHADVERHLDLDRPYWSAQSYRHLLEKFWGIYHPLEKLLASVDWANCGIEFSERSKTDWLLADLAYCDIWPATIGDLDVCNALPRLDDMASGLGALYVLEGATLGGQVILRNIGPQLGLSQAAGGRFFASYGSQVGAMWRDYLSILERQAGATDVENAITRSAVETFSAFERWFAGARTGTRSDQQNRSSNV